MVFPSVAAPSLYIPPPLFAEFSDRVALVTVSTAKFLIAPPSPALVFLKKVLLVTVIGLPPPPFMIAPPPPIPTAELFPTKVLPEMLATPAKPPIAPPQMVTEFPEKVLSVTVSEPLLRLTIPPP